MGSRRKADSIASGLSIAIHPSARRMVEFQAAESYPLEVGGYVIGRDGHFEAIATITRYVHRDGVSMETDRETFSLADELFGDDLVAEWHSHPGSLPTISRLPLGGSDLSGMNEGDIEWIVSLWPGKRNAFCFRHRIYRRVGAGVRIVKASPYVR